MMKMKHAVGSMLLLTITASGLAVVDCPHNMPTQLLQDCLLYEIEGESFPADDYAHMDEYQAWLKTQKPETQPSDPKTASKMNSRQHVDLFQVQP
jgi:hypothetical protein